MDKDKAIRAAKLTLGGMLEKKRHTTAVSRADGQVSPSKYLPNVPRQVHADGGKVAFMQGNHPDVPDVVYHGTNRDIRSFDPEAQRNYDIDPKSPDSTDTGWFGKGHYFAPRPKRASYYAEEAARRSQGKGAQVYPVHLSMKNPFVVNMRDSDSGATTLDKALNSVGVPMHPRGYRMPSEQTAALIGMGHDGVIAKREGKTEEIVAFHPNQIKSAIGNQGTFDPTDPDITKADGGEVDGGFEVGKKYNGVIPQIKYLPVRAIERQPSQYEVSRVSDDVAKNMDFSEPVEATAFRYGSNNSEDHPSVALQNGHHRLAAAHQTGRPHLPVTITAVNAKGEKLNALKKLSDEIERSIITKAAGGAAMFEGISEHLTDDEGKPMELWHGTTQPEEFEAFDDAKLGRRDAGFYGRGHYLTPEKDTADEYGEDGTVIGPLHAALKNPYVWDVSSDMKAHSTLRDLQSMGIMKEKSKLDFWDNLQSHHVQPFMAEMRKRGHDGVVVKTGAAHLPNGISEVVAFDPKTIKHTEAEAFDPTDPRIRREDGGEVDGNDNFRNWFGNSVTHTDGKPHVFYTGTSKDKDFTSHNVGRHGAWFVRDPAVASEYAEQNDSQGYKRDGWEITKTNTASRVIPAYVKAENPYTGDLPQEVLRDNYKAAQSEWFDTLRAKGHDSWIPASQNGNLVVALKEPQQIKSIFNSGKFDPNQKHMNKAVGGAAMGYVPMAALPVGRLALAKAPIQQPQGGVGQFSGSLSSLMDTVKGFKEKPEDVKSQTSPPLQKEAAVPSAATEGHPPQETGGMSEEALAAYGKLQDAYGQPLNVISTYRDPQKNQDVGGAKGSQHLHGNAYDIDVSNMSYEDRLALADLAWNSGFRGIGFYDNSLHFDVGDPRSWGPSYSRDSIPDWAQDWTENRYGYSGGGSAMDDDNQNTGDNSNVESLSLARSLRNIGSGGGDDRVQGLFEKIAAGQQQAQKAYEMAHSNGEFDDFKIGDTFVYKHSKYPTPMKVTGFSVSRAEAFPQRKRIYNNHVPVLEMENQDAEKKVNKYPVEWFQENLHKYDFVSGKPRAVKAGGGAMDDSGQNGAMENGNAPINFETRPQAGGLLNAGGVRGSSGVFQAQDEAPLEGLPTKIGIPLSGQSVTAGPDPRIRQVARDYMASTGMKYNPPTKYAKVDPIRARRIAAAYEGMKDDPNDPLTKASYDAMIKETMAQYNHAKKAGLKVEFWNPEKQEDPYGASPRLATEDVRKNHHMWVFPTYAGYGSGDPISEDDAKKNPLLQLTGETWNGIPVTVNDVFRAVHDYYGHAKEGVGFRADGEENAWRSHASMYSPLARMAMTSETRGQNSWLNYGPHGEKNRNARTEDTIFAPQKIGVMPHWAHHEGAEDFTLPEDVEAMQRIRSNFDPAVSKALALTRRFTKGGESAINTLKSKGK